MNIDLYKKDTYNTMLNNIEGHKEMIDIINKSSNQITKSTTNFGKHQSQFMDNIMILNNNTPLRNIRQILAEMQKTKLALREAYIGNKRKEIEVNKLEKQLELCNDENDKRLIELDIIDKLSQIEESKLYISGAVRRLTNYTMQYNNILKSLGKEEFTEEDFENEEERYHIMKAFEQALTASRSRNGVIDEGNHIYFIQIGINGSVAQREIINYLTEEGKMISEGKEPTHIMQIEWLNKMANKFIGCAKQVAEYRNILPSTNESLLRLDNGN